MTRPRWLRPLAAPTRRVWGLTWVGWLNFLVLRWFFVRLAYSVPPRDAIGWFLTSAPQGGTALIEIDLGNGPPTRWFLNRWIRPVPWTACRYVGRPRGARPA